MTACAPRKIGPRSDEVTSALTNSLLPNARRGSRRATATISVTDASADNARTTLVPTFPVAPVTTTFMSVSHYRQKA